MGLETGTWVSDLVPANPPGSDKKSQGDDHLRLIKQVLQNTFPRTAKAFYFQQNLSKTADYVVQSADDNSIISCDTSGGSFTLTLPTLAAGDAGWTIEIIKTNTGANPVFIAPPSGTINGFTKIRRTLEYVMTRIRWNGSAFFASRPNGGTIGSIRDFHGTSLPNDCVWPDGTTFTAANYVELNSVLGGNTKPDHRGRVSAGRDDLGGVAAGRIGTLVTDSGTIVGTTLGSAGGSSTHVQTTAELATHNHGITDPGHFHSMGIVLQSIYQVGGVSNGMNAGGSTGTDTKTTGITINNQGSSTAMAWLQPTIIVNKGLVAE